MAGKLHPQCLSTAVWLPTQDPNRDNTNKHTHTEGRNLKEPTLRATDSSGLLGVGEFDPPPPILLGYPILIVCQLRSHMLLAILNRLGRL